METTTEQTATAIPSNGGPGLSHLAMSLEAFAQAVLDEVNVLRQAVGLPAYDEQHWRAAFIDKWKAIK